MRETRESRGIYTFSQPSVQKNTKEDTMSVVSSSRSLDLLFAFSYIWLSIIVKLEDKGRKPATPTKHK